MPKKTPQPTTERIVIPGTRLRRVVYVDHKGTKYIKKTGAFIRLNSLQKGGTGDYKYVEYDGTLSEEDQKMYLVMNASTAMSKMAEVNEIKSGQKYLLVRFDQCGEISPAYIPVTVESFQFQSHNGQITLRDDFDKTVTMNIIRNQNGTAKLFYNKDYNKEIFTTDYCLVKPPAKKTTPFGYAQAQNIINVTAFPFLQGNKELIPNPAYKEEQPPKQAVFKRVPASGIGYVPTAWNPSSQPSGWAAVAPRY